MASNFYMPDWAFAPPSPPEPPPLPTATDLNIPVEAYAASTSYAMDPSLELGPELWDEVDRANARAKRRWAAPPTTRSANGWARRWASTRSSSTSTSAGMSAASR